MVIVYLSESDRVLAKESAKKVEDHANKIGAKKSAVTKTDLLQKELGYLGEIAVSKCLGIKWAPQFFSLIQCIDKEKRDLDVSVCEVRTTAHPNGKLILHDNDLDDAPYVLVVADKMPKMRVIGYINGRDGKKKEYWKDVGYGRPCYYVPHSELLCIKGLM